MLPTNGIKGSPCRLKFVNLTSINPFHISATVCSVSLIYVKSKLIALGFCTIPFTVILLSQTLSLSPTVVFAPATASDLINHLLSILSISVDPSVCDNVPIKEGCVGLVMSCCNCTSKIFVKSGVGVTKSFSTLIV